MPFPIAILADAEACDFRFWGDGVGGGQPKIEQLKFTLNAVWPRKNGRHRLLQLLIEIADTVDGMLVEAVAVWLQVLVLQATAISGRPHGFRETVAVPPPVSVFLQSTNAFVSEAVQFRLSAWRFQRRWRARGLRFAWRNLSVALRIQPDIACMRRVCPPTPGSIRRCPKSVHMKRQERIIG